MALDGRSGRGLRLGPAHWVWLLAVLAVHAWLGGRWLALQGEASALPPIEPLKVQMRRTMTLQAPPKPADAAQAVTRRLAAAPAQPAPPVTAAPPLEAPPAPPESAALEAAPSLPDPPPLQEAVRWPLSALLRYRLVGHYNGPVHGDAEVRWLRQGLHYQVRLVVSIGPQLAPLVRRELVSEGRITEAGVHPERYDEETRLLIGPARRLSLLRQGELLRLADGRWLPAPAGLQDSASQFVQLAFLFLSGQLQAQPGALVELPLALPRSLQGWRYELVGQERLETPLGSADAWHLRPKDVHAPGALMAEVWLVPELQYLPAQMLIRQGEHAWVRLSLAEPPLQEDEPADAPQNAASQPAPHSP